MLGHETKAQLQPHNATHQQQNKQNKHSIAYTCIHETKIKSTLRTTTQTHTYNICMYKTSTNNNRSNTSKTQNNNTQNNIYICIPITKQTNHTYQQQQNPKQTNP